MEISEENAELLLRELEETFQEHGFEISEGHIKVFTKYADPVFLGNKMMRINNYRAECSFEVMLHIENVRRYKHQVRCTIKEGDTIWSVDWCMMDDKTSRFRNNTDFQEYKTHLRDVFKIMKRCNLEEKRKQRFGDEDYIRLLKFPNIPLYL